MLAFTILWGIIGGVIIFGGTFLGALRIIHFVPYEPYIIVNFGAIGVIFIVWIIGFLLMFLGTWASAFRIAVNLAIEEMKKTAPATVVPPVATQVAGAQTPTCPKCGTPLTYVQQYQRWYCPTCREYQ
ncbi:MAG: hypothetical protein ACUVQ0_03085 [Thermoproteota archaeon]